MSEFAVERYASALEAEFADRKMVVFLCGPSESLRPQPGAELRYRLRSALSENGFEVVLGEDDGLEHLQQLYGLYAHQNERKFVDDQMAAVVLVADSVGSFCELGMFADSMLGSGVASKDFVLIANEKYKDDRSYFNLGPAHLVNDFWALHYADFSTFDPQIVVRRLRGRRAVWLTEFRGRPRSGG